MAGFALIKVFCDTNILHASQAHLMLSAKVTDYVAEHQRIESVDLKWMLPRMVIDERRHQMIQAARDILPSIEALEKLLGHSLGINDEILEDRIDSKIKKAIKDLQIDIVDLDHQDVDWPAIIDRSARRRPPFEISGDKEKGFRDVVIAQTFLQELSRSPATPRSCLLVFVTGDKRLSAYIEEMTRDSKNVRVLESLDDLKSLLNAIASEITEEFLKEIRPKALDVFWDFEKKEGLYGKEEIYKKITSDHASELLSALENHPNSRRNEKGVRLSDLTFIKKDGQTVVWRISVILSFEVLDSRKSGLLLGSLTATQTNLLAGNTPIPLAQGRTTFSVEWQHQITTAGKVSRGKINSIDFLGHEFDE